MTPLFVFHLQRVLKISIILVANPLGLFTLSGRKRGIPGGGTLYCRVLLMRAYLYYLSVPS